MSCINDKYFEGRRGERSQMIARGFQLVRDDEDQEYLLYETLQGHSVPKENGGLDRFWESKVDAGESLYRFGRRGAEKNSLLSGAWWFRQSVYMRLKHHAARMAMPIGYVAKLAFAVPDEWSDCGSFVTCRANKPLRVFEGVGNRATGSGRDIDKDRETAWTPIQDNEILQLYIPGMQKCGDTALEIIDSEDLRTADTFKAGAAILSGSRTGKDRRPEAERILDVFNQATGAR